MNPGNLYDLVVVTPDGAYQLVLEALFDRPESLGIRSVKRKLLKDPLHDSGSDLTNLLRPLRSGYHRALVIRDLAGSGWERRGRQGLEEHLYKQLCSLGWAENDCTAIVVEPEIESWLRLPSPHLDRIVIERARRNRELDISGQRKKLIELIERHDGFANNGKPVQPKEVFEDFLFYFGIPRSNSLYQRLAQQESLTNCMAPSFIRLRNKLQTWFPAQRNNG